MTPPTPRIRRALGTMVAYGFERGSVAVDLDVAAEIGASVLEILPDWARFPDPNVMRVMAEDRGLRVHSAHGCWGGTTIRARRVDLGSLDPATRAEGLDDLRRCLDWLADAGGSYLVVHPGGYSNPEDFAARRDRLRAGLVALADHAGPSGPVVCVENLPPGVHPGTSMADLADLLGEIDHPALGLALDTGHANMVASAASETLAAGALLRTTHVHDNNGRSDTHEPPGVGTVDWSAWIGALDAIDYRGPILLECIRKLRATAEARGPGFLALVRAMTGDE